MASVKLRTLELDDDSGGSEGRGRGAGAGQNCSAANGQSSVACGQPLHKLTGHYIHVRA